MTAVPAGHTPPFPHLSFLPEYDPQLVDIATRNLLDLYAQAERHLNAQWATIVDDPLAVHTRARVRELLVSLERSRASVSTSVAQWIRTTYPGYYAGGATNMLANYEGGPFRWAQPHRDAVGLLAVDTYDRLLHATSFEPAEIKQTVRELAREASGVKLLGGQTATQAGRRLADRMRAVGISNVTYADGRIVRSSTYADMVIRTKTAVAYNVGGINAATADGVEYFEINDGLECGLETHDSKPAAAGMIVTADVAQLFPISHPNCVRSFYPRPDVSKTQVDDGSVESLTDPLRAADQENFDAFLRQEEAANGLTIRQAAAKFGRLERSGRTPRVGRAARGAEPVAPPEPVAIPEPEPGPAHPFLAPLEGTEAHPFAHLAPGERESLRELYQRPDGSDWLRADGITPGPKAVARAEAFDKVGGNVLDEVERRLEARGLSRPPTETEITKVSTERAKSFSSLVKRERKIEPEFERAHPEWSYDNAPKLPRNLIDLDRAERDAAYDAHHRATVEWEKARREALKTYDPRLRSLIAKVDRLNARETAMIDDKINNEAAFYTQARETVREVLSEIRSMGGNFDNIAGIEDQLRERVARAGELFPTDWVEASNTHDAIAVVSGPRGEYEERAFGAAGSKVTLSDKVTSKVAGDPVGYQTALHEFAHRMEQAIPEIRQLESAFYVRRTAGQKLVKLNKLFPLSSYTDAELAVPDDFTNPYMGKPYGDGGPASSAFELLSMGIEGLWTGSQDVWADRDMLRWVLGILAAA